MFWQKCKRPLHSLVILIKRFEAFCTHDILIYIHSTFYFLHMNSIFSHELICGICNHLLLDLCYWLSKLNNFISFKLNITLSVFKLQIRHFVRNGKALVKRFLSWTSCSAWCHAAVIYLLKAL